MSFSSAQRDAQAPGEAPATAATTVESHSYSAAEVDAAIAALGDPERLSHAQEVVTHAAPALQRILLQALEEGGWFGSAHAAEVQRAAGEADMQERLRAVDVLVAEQTRLGMFVGVTVGFQLARELARSREQSTAETSSTETTAISSTQTSATSSTETTTTATEEP